MTASLARTRSDAEIIGLLHAKTYEEVSALTGMSRGAIYQIALRAGARKTEARIRERAETRRRRQEDALRAMLETTATADVLDFLEALPDDSAEMFVTSPPYNVGKTYAGGASADRMRHVYYHGWLMQVISEIGRILKPGGTVFLQVGQTRDDSGMLMPLDTLLHQDLVAAGLTYRSRVVWTMPHGLTPKGRLAERYETALIFSKGDTQTFNPNAARLPQKNPGKRAFKGPNRGSLSGHPLGAWPTNVWDDIATVRHNHPDRRHSDHPAQFPVALARRAILLYSKPGDLVVDPFSGSGSTQIAALETGRSFVGADLSYGDIREARLREAHPDNVTPLPGVSDASIAVWQAEARKVEVKARPRNLETEQADLLALA